MEYLTIKILIHATTCMNLEDMLSEKASHKRLP